MLDAPYARRDRSPAAPVSVRVRGHGDAAPRRLRYERRKFRLREEGFAGVGFRQPARSVALTLTKSTPRSSIARATRPSASGPRTSRPRRSLRPGLVEEESLRRPRPHMVARGEDLRTREGSAPEEFPQTHIGEEACSHAARRRDSREQRPAGRLERPDVDMRVDEAGHEESALEVDRQRRGGRFAALFHGYDDPVTHHDGCVREDVGGSRIDD